MTRMTMTRRASGMLFALVAATAAMVPGAYAQQNLYREDGWAKLPDGRKWGQTSAIDIDRARLSPLPSVGEFRPAVFAVKVLLCVGSRDHRRRRCDQRE